MTLWLYQQWWHAQGIKIIMTILVSKLVRLLIYIFWVNSTQKVYCRFLRQYKDAT